MRFNTLFFLLMGFCLSITLAQGTYEDCCLRYVKTLSGRVQRHAVKYRWQVPDGDCNLVAVIFTMRKGREFCTDPKESWVGDLMERVDRKGKNGSKNRSHQHRH
ncbi:C-C motif chemokine 25 [Labrus mixtus]|uniref:C-C motif chemokine 25 n=1 Tax=Labrus mixtus TaxID=508554 RepID=UPI0029C0BF9A|nr:C-C motif chemokine 25 [Labrus mixtus]